MRGLLAKALRETWLQTLLFAGSLFLVQAMLTWVLPQLQQFSDVFLQIGFAKTMMSALLGVEIEGELTAQMLQSIVLVHPVVLTLIWTHEIMLCTRLPVAEIDRGTIDVLLGLPVSRRALYTVETVVWLVSGLLMIGFGMLGYFWSSRAMAPEHRPDPRLILLVVTNLYGVYLAVGGIAFLSSALHDRRGRAIGVVFGIVLSSFLLTFLAQFWAPAQRLAFLSVLDYYQPARVLGEGALTARDVTVLLGIGAATWVLGGEIFARRDIRTV